MADDAAEDLVRRIVREEMAAISASLGVLSAQVTGLTYQLRRLTTELSGRPDEVGAAARRVEADTDPLIGGDTRSIDDILKSISAMLAEWDSPEDEAAWRDL